MIFTKEQKQALWNAARRPAANETAVETAIADFIFNTIVDAPQLELTCEPGLDNPKVISKFQYGSRVYGCNTSESDFDFIVVREQPEEKIDSVEILGNNFTFYNEKGFQKDLDNHEISALECFFLPAHMSEGKTDYTFELNLQKLRHSISQVSSNSWVKAKKKLADGETYIAQKSLFHSLRIVEFGIQIATHGKIVDYSSANCYLDAIKKMPLDWSVWESRFKQTHKLLLTDFRKLAPKI
ncbi:MAG: hypothetical protein WC979_02920 [Candidatus Pacearchaeota archaeon]|jgi:hypothetical protein|nr:hypothetical protein [Clostridia bacterium]